MGLLKNTKNQNMTEGQKLTSRYNSARHNILLVIAFTLINCVLCAAGSSSYFLFSAAIPYYLVTDGLYWTGKMPAEWYGADFQADPDNSYLYICLAVSVVIVAFFALTWFLSKKYGYGWLVAALVLFVADTFAMFYFYGFSADMIMDFAFHAWVLVSLASGIIAAINLKKLPEEEPYLAQEGQTYSYIPQAEMPIENNEVYAPAEQVVTETENNQEITE